MKISKHLYMLLLLIAVGTTANAQSQCEVKNNYFKAGENLTYNLYYKYGLLYIKAGSSTLSVVDENYQGTPVYKATLTANLTGMAKSIHALSDTLQSYLTPSLVPLAYSKDDHQSEKYYTERATFTYKDGKVIARNISTGNGKLRYDTTHVANRCTYDMVSIIYYARTLNYSNMKKGDKTTVSGLVGRRLKTMEVIYQGIETVKANDDREYYCIKLSLMMDDDAFSNKEEAMKIYLTNDANRIPIRIDSKLKVGSTRVILKEYKGLKN